MSLNLTGIEWVLNPDGTQGYTWNPLTGCLNHTPEGLCLGGMFPCYAYKLAHGRLKPLYLANKNWDTRTPKGYEGYPNLDPFYPRFWEERLEQITYFVKHPTRKGIFVCDMGELFGDWVPRQWQKEIFNVIYAHPWHRFYLLTKQPQNLPAWSPFPDNCWVGVTATNYDMARRALYELNKVTASIKYISFEPLLAPIYTAMLSRGELDLATIQWVIIGACTGTLEDIKQVIYHHPELESMPLDSSMRRWTAQPKIEWVEEIETVARKAGIYIFEKNNLKPLLKRELIQELPKC